MGKGEKGRVIVAEKLALRSVGRYLEVRREGLGRNGDRLFTNSNGSPMTTDGNAHICRRLRRRVCIRRLLAHVLRDSFAVQLLRSGRDDAQVCDPREH